MSKFRSTLPAAPLVTPWRLVLAAWTVLIWGRFLVFPWFVAGTSLDGSWMQALGHFYRTNAQDGTDYVFTYGSLGYFATEAYDSQLYWPRYIWELAVKLASAAAIMTALAGLPRRGLTLLGAALVIVFVPYHFDTIYLVTLLALGVLLIEGAWPRAAGWLPLLTMLAMTKFTYFVLAIWIAALAEASVRLRGYRSWWSPILLFGVCVCGVWLGCRQDLSHFWAYCRNSADIAAGYSEAMSAAGSSLDLQVAAATMALAVLLLSLAIWRNRRRVSHLCALLMLGPGLFLGWKNGLIRHDDHAFLFFGMALFAALMLPRYVTSRVFLLLVTCLLIASIGGMLLTAHHERENLFLWSIGETRSRLDAALHPLATRDDLESNKAEREKQWRLDRVREVVGEATIDQLSREQGVILLNGFNWHPRPVFQSYTVYTPTLLRLNADYYRSDAAPEYILCNLQPIDERLAAMEDSLALLEILHRYTPVLREKQFVLFKRIPHDEQPRIEPEAVRRRTIHFGEWVRLDDEPGDYQWLSLRFAPSIRGRILGALFKRGPLHLEIETTTGETRRYRLVPAMSEAGFLINPLVEDTDDFVRLYGATPGQCVESFRVTRASEDFKDDIEMTLSALPRPACRTLAPDVLEAIAPH